MGNLLGAPETSKDTHSGVTPEDVPFAVSNMQGWRISNEDAHVLEGSIYASKLLRGQDDDDNNKEKYEKIPIAGHSLFAVFDGHGGTFAATYAGANLCRVLSRQPKFVQYAHFCQERAQKEATLDEAKKVDYVRSGLELLEGALCDAFVELDREIANALQGSQHPEANTPYNETTSTANTANDDKKDDDGNKKEQDADKKGPDDSPMQDAQNLENEGDSGTTACVVLLTPDWIVCANAGDTRAVFSKHGHKAVPLSYDHKPDDEEEERRIRFAGGYVAGGRVEGDLAVSRGLGDFRFKNMETVMAGANAMVPVPNQRVSDDSPAMLVAEHQKVSPVPDIIVQNRSAAHDEFILLACDGIWDVQTNYEAVMHVADLFAEGETNLGLICEEICDLCLTKGSKDNMTALLIKFPGQQVGRGGGVLARRQKREAEAVEMEKGELEQKNAESSEPS